MLLPKGIPRFEVDLLRIDRTSSARYSVRWPVSANSDWFASRAMPTNLTACPSSAKRDGGVGVFAFPSLMPITLRRDEECVKRVVLHRAKPRIGSSCCAAHHKFGNHFQQ